ncbi:MAG TPA: hypothetical protein VER83_03230 [Candidatus Nanopelagicales bacterium]|nr:hypothetical protein [Candidatus Nanopelagicales bacterium]
MHDWHDRLRGDPLPWLLDQGNPAVRHLALRDLLGRAPDDADVRAARAAATRTDPIAAILAAQDPAGWWEKPGPGYASKYRGTAWQLIFLDQLGADPAEPRVRAACEYVLAHSQSRIGGFGASGVATESPPPPSTVIHCLNGNLLRALVGFGWLDDERVGRAIAWQAAAITGEGDPRWNAVTPGPGFRCGANESLPCAWGATKALLALARIPPDRRTAGVAEAVDVAVDFLLSRDPAVADYPMGYGNTKPNGSWFRLGFPSGYVADVLQVLEALVEAGAGGDPRLTNAVDWLLAQQDAQGRWANRYAYAGKMWVDIDAPGAPSRWVTLRACRVLRAIG